MLNAPQYKSNVRSSGRTGSASLLKESACKPITLAVVIVNYRTPALVIQCLESLVSELAGLNARAIIVDNCSRDGSVAMLRHWTAPHDRSSVVDLIESTANGGFSSGNNMGISARDAEFYLLLNSDTIVRNGAVSALLRTAEKHPEAGLVSPRLEWPDGAPQESCFRYPSPVSEFIDAAQTGFLTSVLRKFDVPLRVSDGITKPPWTSFACVLVRRKLFEQIGLLDDGFFMYFEDVEFCLRARNAGWEIVNNPVARVVHLRGGQSPDELISLQSKRPPSYYYAARTRYFFLAYGRFGLTLANLLCLLGCCISKVREVLQRRSFAVPEKKWVDIWTAWRRPDAQGVAGAEE